MKYKLTVISMCKIYFLCIPDNLINNLLRAPGGLLNFLNIEFLSRMASWLLNNIGWLIVNKILMVYDGIPKHKDSKW